MRFQPPGHCRTATDFAARWREVAPDLGCDEILLGAAGPLGASIDLFGCRLSNRFAIHPMEGWDAEPSGAPSDLVLRRWRRFGSSGASLVWGGEAFAVDSRGRANPRQLCYRDDERLASALEALRRSVREGQRDGGASTMCVGLQLTHSGRFSRTDDGRPAPVIASRRGWLDTRAGATEVTPILSDDELDDLVPKFVRVAQAAQRAGFDFVDVKACHGYLVHELLSAYTRSGPYGGAFENRSRFLLTLVDAVRRDAPGLGIGVRLSAGDVSPHERDPASGAGKPIQAPPPAFGRGADGAIDLDEPLRLIRALAERGVGALSITVGSPYWCPHLQRPASYPPSDGYQPPRDPLFEVAEHLRVVRRCKQEFRQMPIVGAGYTYLQEWLPHVAQHEVAHGHVDFVGLGRMVLAYPTFAREVLQASSLVKKAVCRTFSDCTTGPRNGYISGCYPLDPDYRQLPQAATIAALRRGDRGR